LYPSALRAFPFSGNLWQKAIAKAGADRNAVQALFEEAAHAYALKKTNPMLRKVYIDLARALNLDSFADLAEQEQKDTTP
jgi:3-keto-L-gulonate-6-phosphate decarboxylase